MRGDETSECDFASWWDSREMVYWDKLEDCSRRTGQANETGASSDFEDGGYFLEGQVHRIERAKNISAGFRRSCSGTRERTLT